MLDVFDFITDKGGDPKKVLESQKRRYASEEVVDEVIKLWEDARATRYQASQVGTKINSTQKEIGLKKRAKEDASELLAQKASLEKEKKDMEDLAAEKEAQVRKTLNTIGNYVHDSVPVGNDEEDNELIRKWAPEGVTVEKKDLAKTAQLEDFDEALYKVTEDGTKETDKYLIATSEQPISALHSGEWLQEKDLPIKYAGYSTCYRKEAGSHGKDAWGLFRIHQFEKIEQFIFTKPEDSWEAFDNMIGNAEEFYKSLGLPYRVVAIVSGALNNAASKKYDLEAWFPFQGEYKELVSCSNCTDYQSRALDIRYGTKTQTDIKKKFVHALNCTLCATERALCCVLENYQRVGHKTADGTVLGDGVLVPEVLRKYIPGSPEFLPYTKELPKDSTSQKAKGKAGGPKTKIPAGGASIPDRSKN
ncbi:MAG: Cytosolic seryl-tRNA synthetase [Cirrosporium novae-zelandiae]|nr:MAG: Cytosolic seryl-tRNA synthetase [Cirrosporium novae-zelandiae]